ncbi:phosphoribulokinase / Uridine kinase family protein [Hokovirus HKV1]|uniref:Phosphoribulokinase / Uridine kinase family protein n=1 Tax=Hokovirus HKV1 TaxID=1977638 RepID=A0A1V0SEN1_9VIRU|nr:phosphoribulokinase / Uridine kinase family protein [Hokovirus HKV1]
MVKKIYKFVLTGGPSCCGKTTLCNILKECFNTPEKTQIVVLSMDNYYKSLHDPTANYDDPNAIDFELLIQHIKQLLSGSEINVPNYLFEFHCRDPVNTTLVKPAPVIILEGIFVQNDKRLVELADFTMMIKCEDWKLVDRRHVRDVKERGRTPESISKQLNETVMPGKHKFIDPFMHYADVVLDNNEDQHFQNSETVIPYIQQLINDTSNNKISPEEYLKKANKEEIEKLKQLLQNY